MKKYNLKNIMLRAWKIYRSGKDLSFSECLHRAWLSEKALFGCELIWGSRGDGQTYKARFFGESQVEAIA